MGPVLGEPLLIKGDPPLFIHKWSSKFGKYFVVLILFLKLCFVLKDYSGHVYVKGNYAFIGRK